MKRKAEERQTEEAPPEEGLLVKKSRLRHEIEELLEKKGLVLERKISVMNLESGEARHFDDYSAALEFLKGKKGRWYITTPGLKNLKDNPVDR